MQNIFISLNFLIDTHKHKNIESFKPSHSWPLFYALPMTPMLSRATNARPRRPNPHFYSSRQQWWCSFLQPQLLNPLPSVRPSPFSTTTTKNAFYSNLFLFSISCGVHQHCCCCCCFSHRHFDDAVFHRQSLKKNNKISKIKILKSYLIDIFFDKLY